jgi:hypothetical protein
VTETVEIPKRLPLVATQMNRDESGDQDSRLINAYVEKLADGSGYRVYKRPGTSHSTQPSGGAATGRGMWNWKDNLYTVWNGTLYKDTTSLGAVDATGGVYKFAMTLGATPRLVLGNGVKAYTYDGATLAVIPDADFPATFVKGWAYLDGTTYVMTSSASIQGSDINDPTSYNILNVIVAQIEPDGGVALGKQLVYVIAFKEWTTEVFYDAANSTGSPLGTVQGAKVNKGCISADSVVDVGGALYFLASNRESGIQVGRIDGLKYSDISDASVERLLQAGDYSTVYAFGLAIDGHEFYVVTLKNSNLTLAYDIGEKMWARWTDASGNYFPFVAAATSAANVTTLQHETDGYTYSMSTQVVSDNGSVITSDLYLPQFDGGTKRGKYLGAMLFETDRVQGSVLLVRSNDNDYRAGYWTDFRQVDLGSDVPMLTDEGTFTRRAYHFRHASLTKLGLKGVDLQIDLCTL